MVFDSLKTRLAYRNFDVCVKFQLQAPADQGEQVKYFNPAKALLDLSNYFSDEADYFSRKGNGEKVKRKIDNEIPNTSRYTFNKIEKIGNGLLTPLSNVFEDWDAAQAQLYVSIWKKTWIVIKGSLAALPAIIGLTLKSIGEAFNRHSSLRNQAIAHYSKIIKIADDVSIQTLKSTNFEVLSSSLFFDQKVINTLSPAERVEKSFAMGACNLELLTCVRENKNFVEVEQKLKQLSPDNEEWKKKVEGLIQESKRCLEIRETLKKTHAAILAHMQSYNAIAEKM